MAKVIITVPNDGGGSIQIPHNELDGLQGLGPDYIHLSQEEYDNISDILADNETKWISTENLDINDNVLTYTNVIWKVNGIIYNLASKVVNIASADPGFYRTDLVVGNNLGQLNLIPGVQDQFNPVTPSVPLNSAVISVINVFGDSIQIPPDIDVPTLQQVLEAGRTGFLTDGGAILLGHTNGTDLAALEISADSSTSLTGKIIGIVSLNTIDITPQTGTVPTTNNGTWNLATNVNGVFADETGTITIPSNDTTWNDVLQNGADITDTALSTLSPGVLFNISGGADSAYFSLYGDNTPGSIIAALGTDLGFGFIKNGLQVYQDESFLRGPFTISDQPLTLQYGPTLNNHATTKEYVDDGLSIKANGYLQNNVAYFIDNGKFNSGPLAVRNGNTIFTFFREGTGHIGNDGKTVMTISTDEGKTQSAPITVLSETGIDIRQSGGGITPTGRIILFLAKYDADTQTSLSQGYIYSDNNGSTWSTYQTIPHATTPTEYSPYGKMIEIGDNKLMISWYGTTAGNNSVVYIITSSNNGSTWSSPVTVSSTPKLTAEINESGFRYLGNNIIIGLCRNDNSGKFKQVISTDNAVTWSSQGEITKFGTSRDVSPLLDEFIDYDGTEYIVCFYAGRVPLPSQIRAVLAKKSDLPTLGIDAWITNTDFAIGYGTNTDMGYPAVVKSKDERRFLVCYYRTQDFIPSFLGPGESYIEYRNYIADYALNQKANLFGGNVFDNGFQIFNNAKLGVNAVPFDTAKSQIHNDLSDRASYPFVTSSVRGGYISALSLSNTQDTDLASSIIKFSDPKNFGGTSQTLYAQYGNGNTIIGGNIDRSFKLDVQGTGAFTNTVSIGTAMALGMINTYQGNSASTTYGGVFTSKRNGVFISGDSSTTLSTDTLFVVAKSINPEAGSGVSSYFRIDGNGNGEFSNELIVPNASGSASALNRGYADSRYVLQTNILSGSATLDFPNTPPGTSSEMTLTVTGAADGDVVAVGVPNATTTIDTCYTARVSSANTVTIKFNNYSAIAVNPPSGLYKVKVFK